MNRSIKVLAVLAAVLTLFSCKTEYESMLNSSDWDGKYAAAFNYFNQGKYNRAAQLFESLSQMSIGTSRDDTVQYYWGLSNYRYKDYVTAETNFANFLNTFPRSPFASDAAFLRIDCLYRSTLRYELDQTPTRNAISLIQLYLTETPDTEHREVCEQMLKELNARLDRKAYEAAKLYYKMEQYKSSRVAFVNILKDDADNIYREQILYYIAMSSYKYASMSVDAKQRDRYLTFIDDYYNFAGEWPESAYKRELDVLFQRAQKALGRYTGTEEDLKEKEKDFERERSKIMKQTEEGAA